jgi:hypothetical protein
MLMVSGPNVASFDRLWHGKDWMGWHLPFHLYHFTYSTYRKILEKNGFEIVKKEAAFWNPILHFREARLGDGLRADHPSSAVISIKEGDPVEVRMDGPVARMKELVKPVLTSILSGRDLSLYALK